MCKGVTKKKKKKIHQPPECVPGLLLSCGASSAVFGEEPGTLGGAGFRWPHGISCRSKIYLLLPEPISSPASGPCAGLS